MDKELTITASDDHMASQISSLETTDISTIDLNNLDTITIDTSSLTGNHSNTFYSYQYNSGNFSFPQITTTGQSSGLSVKGDAEFDGDVKIQGHSILHLMKKIEDRLAILQEPTPEKLEKYAALKKAYEHYKTLERLIGNDD